MPTTRASIHEDLRELLDHRGLLRKVAEETGTDYKRIHELVTKRGDPGFARGSVLETWLSCASMLAATRADLKKDRDVPFTRWMRLDELKDRLPPALGRKIDCVLELIGPSMRPVRMTPDEIKDLAKREQRFCAEAKRWIDTSIAEMLIEIEAQFAAKTEKITA